MQAITALKRAESELGTTLESVQYDGEDVVCDDCGSSDVSADPWTDDDGNERTEYTCNKCDSGWEY